MMPESSPNGAAPPLRIALCHLDSLVCLPGLNILFAEMGEQIGLVVLSRRFGPRHGGMFAQLRRGLRRSGWRMTLWLGFDIVSAQIASAIAAMTAPLFTAPLLGRERKLRSIRSLAARYGARVIEVADVNDAETIATVSAFAPDLVLVFNFDQILQPAFIDIAASGVINVHPSLLPAFRGPCPVFWAMAQGCKEAGVSLHTITNAEIDAGPVIRQERLAIDRARSAAEITSALFVAGARLLPEAVRELATGNLRPPSRPPSPGDYHGFPHSGDVARAAGQGIRLWRAGFVLRLIAAAIGPGGRRPS
jgi:folate-dependent phosphoribosylglycinamide formyltransferase PurN